MTHFDLSMDRASRRPRRRRPAQHRSPLWRALAIGAATAVVASTGAPTPAWALPGDITTVAGQFAAGWHDATPATAAKFTSPQVGAVRTDDGTAYLYVADRNNDRVRVTVAPGDSVVDGDTVDDTSTTGNETESVATVAGNGSAGFSGDGGAATSARLFRPNSLAVDGAGNLFIGDQYNHRVRMVAHGGDGVVNGGPNEIIITVAGHGNPTVAGRDVGLGDGGPATLAGLNYPTGVAVSGRWGLADFSLYVADLGNHRVRKVDNLDIITTVAGTGTQGSTGDDGPAVDAELNKPIGVTVDGSKLFVASQGDHTVRLVNVDPNLLGSGSNVTANGVTVAPGNIATVAGTATTFPATGGGGFGGDGTSATATPASRTLTGTTYASGCRSVTDGATTNASATVTSATTSFSADDVGRSLSGSGIPSGTRIASVASATSATMSSKATTSATGVKLTIADYCNKVTGSFSSDDVSAPISGPGIPTTDAWGNPTIILSVRSATTAFISTPVTTTASGATLTIAPRGPLASPFATAVKGDDLYISDEGNNRIRKVDSTGTISTVAGVKDIFRTAVDGATYGNGCYTVGDVKTTSGSPTVTASGGGFEATDVGLSISSIPSGSTIIPTGTTITSVSDDGTTVGMSANATTSATGVKVLVTASVIADCYKLTSDTASFSASDVDQWVRGPGIAEGTRIDSVSTTDATTVVLTAPTTATRAGGQTLLIGGHNTSNVATTAKVYGPRGVVVSGSNLYMGDTGNNRIRRIEL